MITKEGLDLYFLGRVIESAKIEDDFLIIGFGYNQQIKIWDDAQYCCEVRHMETDDNLSEMVGKIFLGLSIKIFDSEISDYEHKDCAFLEIVTDDGFYVVKNYNEHNGYYSGFELRAESVVMP